jgi:hypothetical protein
MDKPFTETVLAFSAYRTELTGKPSGPFERGEHFGLETTL